MSLGNKIFSSSVGDGSSRGGGGVGYEDDMRVLEKIQSMMLNLEMIIKVVNQINSNCIEVRDQTFLVIGTLIRNGVDLQSLIFDSDALEVILNQIYPD
jgi:hypothetical protein